MTYFYDALFGASIVLLLVAINGFFVATEFALVSVRRTRIEQLISQGVRSASAVKLGLNDLNRYIAGTQVGITLASLALGWLGEPCVARTLERLTELLSIPVPPALLHTLSYTLSFLFITFIHVVFGELVPKSLALQHPEAVSLYVGAPMSVIVFLLRPVIAALDGTGNFFLRLLKLPSAGPYHSVHSVEELDLLVRQSHQAGVLDDLEREIVARTFHFTELSAGKICTPRGDIDALDLKEPVEELLNQLSQTTHTRLPVHEGDIDNILGVITIHDAYRALLSGHGITDLRPLVHPAPIVPESIGLDRLVEQFREHQTKLAIVVDEHGATAGLVTFKDIVEEVFGQIHSSSSPAEDAIRKLDNGSYILKGEVRLDELARETGLDLEDEDVDTVAGLIMKQLGRVAQVGDSVITAAGIIRVLEMNHLRITQVVLEPREKKELRARTES